MTKHPKCTCIIREKEREICAWCLVLHKDGERIVFAEKLDDKYRGKVKVKNAKHN